MGHSALGATHAHRAKRQRVGGDKENARSGGAAAPPTKKANAMVGGEDALMAELLAGIDASEFDGLPSSPARLGAVPSPVRPKLRGRGASRSASPVKRMSGSPVKRVLAPLKASSPRRQPPSPRRKVPPSPFKAAPPEPPRPRPAHVDVLDDLAKPLRRVKAEPAPERKPLSSLQSNARIPPPITPTPKPAKLDLRPFESTTSITPQAPVSPRSSASVDDYDADWDLDALASMDVSALVEEPKKYPVHDPAVPPPPVGYAPTPWARFTVLRVLNGIFDVVPADDEDDDGPGWGKTLVVSTEQGPRLIQLKERWADLKLLPNDIVNVVSPALDSTGPITITFKDPHSYLVAHPDVLVTMTSIANAMPCVRRPLLSQLVRLPEPPSKAMLYGTILHSLLQGSLTEQSFDAASTRRRVGAELALDERRIEVWGAGLDPGSVAEDLGTKAEDAFASFGRKWIGPAPKADSAVITARDEEAGSLAISGLHDVEEDIWSPKWGLKGKVDASVQAVLVQDGVQQEVVAPLEIKTGRSIGGVRHRAQTLLYTLLMEDRYGLPVPAGLLYYSQRDSIVLVEAKANEVRALVQTRNELAEWMIRERARPEDGVPFLPETVDMERECKNCFSSDVCMLYRKANDTIPEDDPIADLYDDKTAHLTPEHAAFFKHWERLLTLEEQDTVRLRAQLWTMTAPARERKGRCFADMVVAKEEREGDKGAKIGRWVYTFVRAENGGSGMSLLSGHISRNDAVSLSVEPDLLYLARGFVTALTPDSVTITVQKQLDVDTMLKRVRSTAAQRFRIDKDEMSAGMARMRGNLAQLFVKEGDARQRSLVVDLRTPRFDTTRAPKPHEIPSHLNDDQRAAMTKVLTAKDYALVLGMPGTGKTTTVAEIIRAIVARGQSVLLSSYTHSAVDTIVAKLVGGDFDVLRIGNVDKVHPDVKHFTLDAMGPASCLDELEGRLMNPPVVATTCLSIEHPLFFRRKFDYCIVDEASQITLPTCLGPLRCAETFILVGDHFQLPPIVRKPEARAGGLDVSLFRRLSDAHPAAVAPLAAQYRMNEDIMLLSNRLIYEDRLRCGSEEVARQSLVLPHRKACRDISEATCGEECWVQSLMSENAKAVFVDTDELPARDSRAGDLVQNPAEAALVFTLARALVASGVPPGDIAVITPYRQQIKLLMGVFATLEGVEILTADKAQGRDKDVVLVSLVRSNEHGHIGDLLRDWRRINVSFTRAKKKLVVFGSASTLSTDRLMADFVRLMAEREWVLRLPAGADSLHGPDVQVKIEETQESEQRKRAADRKSVVGARLLNSKPFVKEILTEVA